MRIQSYSFFNVRNNSQAKNKQNTDDSRLNNVMEKDFVSFGAVSLKSIQSSNKEIFKSVQNDLPECVKLCLGHLTDIQMSVESWKSIQKIIKRTGFDYTDKSHRIKVKQILANSQEIEKEITDTSFFNEVESACGTNAAALKNHPDNMPEEIDTIYMASLPVEQINIELHDGSTYTITFLKDRKTEVFFDKTIIDKKMESIEIKGNQDIIKKATKKIAKEEHAGKCIILKPVWKEFTSNLMQISSIENIEPEILDAVHIDLKGPGDRYSLISKDVWNTFEMLLNSANKKPKGKISNIKNQKIFSAEKINAEIEQAAKDLLKIYNIVIAEKQKQLTKGVSDWKDSDKVYYETFLETFEVKKPSRGN